MKQLYRLTTTVYLLAIFGIIGSFVAEAETLNLQMKGKGHLLEFHELEEIGEFKELPDEIRSVIFDVDTYCYRVSLRDPENGLRMGTGYHCVSRIEVGGEVVTSLEFVVFRLSDGIIVARINSTVQKNLTGNSNVITHITGFFPKEENILFGTKKFKNIHGHVRLSGGVNLNKFPEVVGLDRLFILKIHKQDS